ncbi:MAG: rhomboid family intramembrane serine protease [Lachnospiraceae bacterium]|nr:rhomboid family intramembrane serine protease [Lachnospiraceae bacterium]
MDEIISGYLLKRGYTAVRSSIPQVRIFFRVDDALAMAVLLVDGRNLIISPEAYGAIKTKTLRMFESKGYTNIKLFSLFLTQNVMNFGAIGAREELSWIIDLSSKRLCIFDNQVADFDNLRPGLEELLAVEGRDSRTTIAGVLSDFFLRNKAPATLMLILINIIVFVFLSLLGSTLDTHFMIEHGAMSLDRIMANYEWYRLFTAVFLHFGLEHLSANMLALWVFGERVEKAVGKGRFIAVYLLSGYIGNAVSLLISYLSGSDVVSAGASGAVFGTIGALFAIVIKNRGRYADLTGGRAVLLVLYSVFSGFAGEGIDNAAHIGGLVTGLLLGFILYRVRETDGGMNGEGKETSYNED